MPRWQEAIAPRPSSNHPGGVNAVYADGHADFISDRVDYEVLPRSDDLEPG